MIEFDPHSYRYPSRRNVVYARRGMACTSVPLGAQLGLDVLRRGGNAVDAAVAMAAAMPILEPTSNGLGSDCFALVWIEKDKKLYGLNASGTAPLALNAQHFRDRGLEKVPPLGWLPVLVPGAPAGWAALAGRFGTKPLAELFSGAISYAREGYSVPVTVAHNWAIGLRRIAQVRERTPLVHDYWHRVFAKADGSAYRAGDVFRWAEYADTLDELAKTNCESFYTGELMKKTVAFSRASGGFFSEEDFTSYQPLWVEPIRTDYRGYTVCEIPPNGHGITALMALNILKGLPVPEQRESAQWYHQVIESIKLAFADAMEYVADPRCMTVTPEQLLSENYAAKRRALIGREALTPAPGDPRCGGTIYLCTADAEGNMVSYIQSNYMGFGAGVAIPGTGISLQNRGANFSLSPQSANCYGPGKRSYHTIIPGFLCRDGEAVGPFGVMGGFMQPQGHVQMMVNTLDYHMNPQESLDAPRIQWVGGRKIQLEPSVDPAIAQELRERGHEVEIAKDGGSMGRGQIIWRTENGGLVAGTEPRCDGMVAAW